jgi:predicted nucleotidyltransferase
VLYAVESGSRCWGFASPNSDWDVRFIYVHPLSWYLSIGDRRDVIEQLGPDDIDLAGWDLRKALRLFQGSNPSMLEWLFSPIVYREESLLISELRTLHAQCPDKRAQMHHYRNLAWGNFQKYINGRDQINLKRYFYVLRALFACIVVERNGRLHNAVFQDHLDLVLPNSPVRAAVDLLLEQKRAGAELGLADRIGVVDDWIDERFAEYGPERMEQIPKGDRVATMVLDRMFLKAVG